MYIHIYLLMAGAETSFNKSAGILLSDEDSSCSNLSCCLRREACFCSEYIVNMLVCTYVGIKLYKNLTLLLKNTNYAYCCWWLQWNGQFRLNTPIGNY